MVGNMGVWIEDEWKWEFKWRRGWFEWEGVMVENFMNEVRGITLRKMEKDEWVWREKSYSSF